MTETVFLWRSFWSFACWESIVWVDWSAPFVSCLCRWTPNFFGIICSIADRHLRWSFWGFRCWDCIASSGRDFLRQIAWWQQTISLYSSCSLYGLLASLHDYSLHPFGHHSQYHFLRLSFGNKLCVLVFFLCISKLVSLSECQAGASVQAIAFSLL